MTVSSARLDAVGRLLVDPAEDTEPIPDFVWTGEPLGQRQVEYEGRHVDVTLYGAVVHGEEVVCVGDHIYLTPDCQGEPCEIARVVSMLEIHESGEKMLEVQWFWRPEHTQMPLTMRHGEREVFISDTLDINAIEAFESKCQVLQLRESDTVPPELRNPHCFYFRRM